MLLRVVFFFYLAIASLSSYAQDYYLEPISEEEKANVAKFLKSKYWKFTRYPDVQPEFQSSDAVYLKKHRLEEYYRSGKNFIRIIESTHTVLKIQTPQGLAEQLLFEFDKVENDHAFNLVRLKVKKTDGTTKVVDLTQAIISDAERNQYKIAIPNLEVGDIIDYYTYFEFRAIFPQNYTRSFKPKTVYPQAKYPIIDYQLAFSLGSSAFLNASMHKLPKFTSKQFMVENIPFYRYALKLNNLAAKPSDISYFLPAQHLPNLRYQLFIGSISKASDVQENISGNLKLNTKANLAKLQDYLTQTLQPPATKLDFKQFKKYVLQRKNKFNFKNDVERTSFLIQYLKLKDANLKLEGFNTTQRQLFNLQTAAFVCDKLDMDYNIIIAFDKNKTNAVRFALLDEFDLMFQVNNSFINTNDLGITDRISSIYNHTNAFKFHPDTKKLSNMDLTANTLKQKQETYHIRINQSDLEVAYKAKQNYPISSNSQKSTHHISYIDSLTANDLLLFTKGSKKKQIEHSWLKLKKVKEESRIVLSNQIQEEIQTAFPNAINMHQLEIIEDNQDALAYKLNYVLKNAFENARNKQLIAIQPFLKYFPNSNTQIIFPIDVEWGSYKATITLDLSNKLSVTNLEQLTTSVMNDSGSFITSAIERNEQITIDVEFKIYERPNIDVKDFAELVNAYNSFSLKKIIVEY